MRSRVGHFRERVQYWFATNKTAFREEMKNGLWLNKNDFTTDGVCVKNGTPVDHILKGSNTHTHTRTCSDISMHTHTTQNSTHMFTGIRLFTPPALSTLFCNKLSELATEVLEKNNAKAHNWGDDQTMEKVSTKVTHTHIYRHMCTHTQTHANIDIEHVQHMVHTHTHTHTQKYTPTPSVDAARGRPKTLRYSWVI